MRASTLIKMPSRHLAWLLFMLLLLSGCAARQAAPSLDGPVFFLPGGAVLTDGQVMERLRRADFILVGERHNSQRDHQAQARVLELAARGGRPPVVGLEMLPRERYDADLYDFIHERLCLESLPAALRWESEWGYDFDLYAPIFAALRDWQLPAHGLNIDNDLRKSVSRLGLAGLSAAQRRQLPAAVALPPPEQREMLAGIFAMHAGMRGRRLSGAPPSIGVEVPGKRQGRERQVIMPLSLKKPFERFVLMQSLWDTVMAEQALRLHRQSGRPALILAGSGHVAHGHGIAHRLRLFAPGAQIISIMPFSGPPQEAGADLADIFYYDGERK